MMTTKLDHPVLTLDDRLLLPAGEELTSKALDELISTNKDTSYKKLSFLEYGTVNQDILHILRIMYVSFVNIFEKNFVWIFKRTSVHRMAHILLLITLT